jgi:hypothetical protein
VSKPAEIDTSVADAQTVPRLSGVICVPRRPSAIVASRSSWVSTGSHMRAWTMDADDIRVADDFDEALLYRTPEIEGFLRSDRDDKFIVIGTKGFGKTLLLKAKRILYQREGRAACLPAGVLLDKPIGDKIFSRELLSFFIVSPLPWSKIWPTATCLATLKHVGGVGDLKVGPALASLIADESLQGVIDHFVRLLDFTPSEL